MTPPFAAAAQELDRTLGPEQKAAINFPHFLEYTKKIEREHPEYLASIGMTAEQLALDMTKPGKTVAAYVEAGEMDPREGRYLLGEATLEDLLGLGYTPEKAGEILDEQAQDRACASSS